MTLLQFRSVVNVAACGFNVSRAAEVLHTSQPSVSKTIRALEDELGEEIFLRTRARIVGLTDLGAEVMALAHRILQDCSNLRALVEERYNEKRGILRISTTHIHARYVLLDVIRRFNRHFPEVHTQLTQSTPERIVNQVSSGAVDLGVSTLPDRIPDNIITLPAYKIDRCVIAPCGHPLTRRARLTIEEVAKYPLIAYDRAYNSGTVVHTVFERHGLVPQISVQANDANVIKAYVAAGLGIAIFQKMALEPKCDKNIEVIEATHIFPSSKTYITIRRGQYLRKFAYDFIRKIVPSWTQKSIMEAMRS